LEKIDAIGDWEQVHKVVCGETFEWPAQPPEVPALSQSDLMAIMFIALSVTTIVAALVALGFFTRYLRRKCRQSNLVDPTEPIPMSFRPTRQPYPSIESPLPTCPPTPPEAPAEPKSCLKRTPAKYWTKKKESLTLYIPPNQFVFEPRPDLDTANGIDSTPPGPYTFPEGGSEPVVGPVGEPGPPDHRATEGGNDTLFCF